MPTSPFLRSHHRSPRSPASRYASAVQTSQVLHMRLVLTQLRDLSKSPNANSHHRSLRRWWPLQAARLGEARSQVSTSTRRPGLGTCHSAQQLKQIDKETHDSRRTDPRKRGGPKNVRPRRKTGTRHRKVSNHLSGGNDFRDIH